MLGNGISKWAAVGLTGLMLSACTGEDGGAAEGGGCEVMSVATLDDPTQRAAMYGMEKGEVTSDTLPGVDVEYLQIPAMLQATGSGQFDVLSTSLPGLVLAREASGLDLRVLGFQTAHTGGGMSIYTRKGSGIESAEDLEGRTLGTYSFGSTSTLQTQLVLADKYGLDFPLEGGDIDWVELDPPTLLNALQQGDVDAALLFFEAGWKAEQDPELTKVAQIDEDFREVSGGAWPVVSALMADQELIQAQPDCISEFQNMLDKSVAYAEDNIEDIAAEVSEPSGTDPEFVVESWQPDNYRFGGSPSEEWVGWAQAFYDLAYEQDAIPTDPTLADLVITPQG